MDRVNEVLKRLTLEEKASLCSGEGFWHLKSVERLGVPQIMVTDGPHGLRKQGTAGEDHVGLQASVPATCFPTAATLANSWDTELVQMVGRAIAEEALQEQVSVVLGPGANIKRSPLCGRNFEYFSEDPYLTGELAAAMINGLQSEGVGASLKHYAVNNQEKRRMTINAVVDERALREIYLAGFEQAVKKAKPWTVMGAYNRVNGIYACEHPELLVDILREEWGFEGVVVTDWGACNDRVLGLKRGLDLEMPSSGGITDAQIVDAVKNGELDEAVLDEAVRRLLTLIFRSQDNLRPGYKYDADAHHNLARHAAGNSFVLLKNEDAVLPLQRDISVAVIGEFAQNPRYQGAGSSMINPTRLDKICDVLKDEGIEFTYARGYELNAAHPDEELVEEACRAAEAADVALVFVGLPPSFESEGYDRQDMRMPEAHNELVRRVAEVNPKTVVVLSCGAPVEMPWLDKVKGLLHTYLGGQAWAPAVVDVLFGRVNPSGKLAETYPISLADTPTAKTFAQERHHALYLESIYVGYRYYEAAEKPVMFPFGFGLSYTTFSYSDLSLSQTELREGEELKVRAAITNTGTRPGSEVVQLYVSDVESTVFRPVKELRGFTKVYLEPGETKTVEFTLNMRDFAYYDVHAKDWVVEQGEFKILIGASSQDIRLEGSIYAYGREGLQPVDLRLAAPSYYNPAQGFTRDEFSLLYGGDVPDDVPVSRPNFDANSTLEDISGTLAGRITDRVVGMAVRKMAGTHDPNDPTYRMVVSIIREAPLRSLVSMSSGAFSPKLMRAIVHWANGRFFRGLREVLKR